MMSTPKRIPVRVLAIGLLVCAASLAGCALFVGTTEVAVEVFDALTSEPVIGASVALGQYNDTTAGDGVYWFRNVAAGSYVLDVAASGYNPHSEAIDVEADVPQTIYVYLDPGATGEISGVVTCQCGRGLAGVAIFLDGKHVATTDIDGSYSFDAPVGQHAVTAGTSDATGDASQSVTVAEGSQQEVDLVVDD
jgi:hypothetical protein